MVLSKFQVRPSLICPPKKLTIVSALCDSTSVPKLPRLVSALIGALPSALTAPRPLAHLSPNVLELDLIHASLCAVPPEIEAVAWEYVYSLNLLADWRAKLETFTSPAERAWISSEGVAQKMVTCMPYVGSLWVKASHRGLVHLGVTSNRPRLTDPSSIYQRLPAPHDGYLTLTHYPPIRLGAGEIVSTTGAGDTLVGGLVAGLVNGGDEADWVGKAMARVGRTLQSRRAVM